MCVYMDLGLPPMSTSAHSLHNTTHTHAPAALEDVKASSAPAWRAAKAACLQGACSGVAGSIDADGLQGVLVLTGACAVPAGSPLAECVHAARGGVAAATAGGRGVAVEVALDAATGELLDARSSCCPGGFHPVAGAFCPCVAALLLAAAAAERAPSGLAAPTQAAADAAAAASGSAPSQHHRQQQQQGGAVAPLPTWRGPSLREALARRALKHDELRLARQGAPLRPPQPGGAGWADGRDLAAPLKAGQRRLGSVYDPYPYGRYAR